MAGLLSAAQLSQIATTVASSLDQSLPLKRKSSTPTADSYGHDTTPYVPTGNIACTVAKPTASQLQLYAGIIASQRAMMMRAMQTTDIREGDCVTYDSLDWTVHGVENAGSYSVTKQFVIVTVV
jgi:hypothetical protein